MSKKNKDKFKKRVKAQILEELTKTGSEPAPKPAIEIKSPAVESQTKTIPTLVTKSSPPESIDNSIDLVRSDLKKSAIIIGSIIIIIVAVFIADNKTGFLLKISEPLFKVLHLGA